MSAWTNINGVANGICGPWFAVLGPLPVAAQMLLTAVPLTALALLVFRFASDQAGIAAVKDQVKAHLLELWLYRDYPAVLLRAQWQVLQNSLAWLGYSLVPLAILIVPVALLLVQVEARFAARPLAPGEAAIVRATLAGSAAGAAAPTLELAPGLRQETPPLRVGQPAAVLWRVRAEGAGDFALAARIGAEPARIPVVVATPGRRAEPLAAASYPATDWRSLSSPAAPALAPGSGIAALEVAYPAAGGSWLGLSGAAWILMAGSLVLGYAVRGLFGVTF